LNYILIYTLYYLNISITVTKKLIQQFDLCNTSSTNTTRLDSKISTKVGNFNLSLKVHNKDRIIDSFVNNQNRVTFSETVNNGPLIANDLITQRLLSVDSTNVNNFFEEAHDRAAILRTKSICETSSSTYRTGWNHHLKFAAILGTNSNLSLIPYNWDLFRTTHPQYKSFMEAYFVFFVVYLVTNIKVIPKTAFGYVTGAKWCLEHIEGADTHVLESSRLLKITKQGILNVWRLDDANKEAKRRRLGVSRDLIISACNVELKDKSDWQNIAAEMFMKVAFMIIARKGELLVTPKQNHHLKYKSVQFSIFNKEIYKEIYDYDDLTSSISCKDIVKYPLHKIAYVHIEKIDMKNDQSGEGHLHTFKRKKEDYDKTKTFCLVSDIYNWCVKSKPTSLNDPFLSYPEKEGKRLVLHYSYPLEALRGAGTRNGLDSKRITLYSLRIGGSTTLASAGVETVTIKRAGGWKGDSFMVYIRECMAVSTKIDDVLSSATEYTIKDMKRWCFTNIIEDDDPFDPTED